MFYLPKLYSKPRAQATAIAVAVYVVALFLFAALAGSDRQCYDSRKDAHVTCSYFHQVYQNTPAFAYGAAILWIPLLAIVIAYAIKKIRHDSKPVLPDTLFYTLLAIYTILTITGLGMLMLGLPAD